MIFIFPPLFVVSKLKVFIWCNCFVDFWQCFGLRGPSVVCHICAPPLESFDEIRWHLAGTFMGSVARCVRWGFWPPRER